MLVLSLGATALTVISPAAAADTTSGAAPSKPVSLAEPGRPDTPARDRPTPPGLRKHVLRDGTVMFTHGPDVVAAGDGSGNPALRTEPTPHAECVTDLAKPKIELVFAYANDAQPMDGPTARFEVRRMFTSMADAYGHNIYKRWSSRMGGYALVKFRVRCSLAGNPTVHHIRLPNTPRGTTPSGGLFDRIVSDLRAAGLRNPDSKYMVLYQNNQGCGWEKRRGEGSIEWDDNASIINLNNGEYGVGASYGINYNCFGTNASKGARTFAHELWHNMGAVQLTAPKSDGRGHCLDGQDLMCPNVEPFVIYYGGVQDVDCQENSYFAWRTTATGWLAGKWNTGDCRNRFLSFYDSRNTCVDVYRAVPSMYQR